MQRKIFKFTVIFLVMTGWIFSGWPQIPFTNFPPAIKEVKAAVALSGSVQLKTGSSSSLVFDSWTPAADQVAILMIAQRDETISASVSGNNLTWTLIRDKDAARAQVGLEVWKGVGSSPTTGSTTVTLTGNTQPVSGIIQQFSGVDTTTPVEADDVDTHAATDDNDMLASTTTVTADAWAVGFGVSRAATFTVPASDTAAISINQQANTGSAIIHAHMWYEGPVATPASTPLGALDDLSASNDWAEVVISLKPAAAAATLTQNDFEFWEDNDALTATSTWGNPDIAENVALNAVPPSNSPIDPGDEIRVRMNISVTGATLATSTEDFILQYKETSDCTDGAAWTDVDVAGGAATWRFSSSTVTDNSTLTTLLLSTSDVAGLYNKSDPTTTNPNAVTAGQELEWDWHLEYNGNAEAHTYCFRMVKSPVAALDGYNSDSYPRIDTRPGTADQMRHGNFFTTGVERGFFWAD